jgi:hypothetical protein
MASVHELAAKNPFLGTWRCCDGSSDVEYTIAAEGGKLVVSGVDKHDGEVAEIRNITWSAATSVLAFEAYWPSSGRFTQYRFVSAPRAGRASVTYTHTAQETWERV